MPVETATYIQSLNASQPAGTDQKAEGDNHLRLLKTVLAATFPNASRAFYFPQYEAISNDETVVVGDSNKWYQVDCSSNDVDVTLPTGLASTLAGTKVTVQRGASELNTLTVAPASGTINGLASQTIDSAYFAIEYTWTGSVWTTRFVGALALLDTVPDESITLAKMAEMAEDGFVANDSGGASVPQHLTVAEATALLAAMVADSGSGGTKGLVPAPATGDAVKALLGDADFHLAEDIDATKDLTADDGYLMLPGGLIVQWGETGSIASQGSTSITFALEFPSACFGLVGNASFNHNTSLGATSSAITFFSKSTTGATVEHGFNETVDSIFWIALGN